MELKNYQHQTLKDLDDYIHVLNESNTLSEAFNRYWEECRGVSIHKLDSNYLRPYSNTVRNVPRVTLKVPTAGGKTFIACNAIGRIFQSLQIGDFPKVVAWFVPSDTILKQTLEKLQNPSHPYRRTIDSLFCHKVTIVDKEAALQGNGLKPEQLQSELVILVLSAQSFVETVKAKKDVSYEQNKPKAYRENGNFFEQSKHFLHPEKLIAGTDPTALIQVIAQQNPLVIIDESHNFRTNLRDEMLANLNPRFILELTATPRDKSNIVSFVDAMQLKKENMVKLPVIVENRNSPADVLSAAIRLRNSLENLAKENEANGGRYIRPIVLFQAQPRTDQDNVTFDKIKQQLLGVGIPENQIKIKTANKDELRGIDIMSRDCEVRYIITVNALKEGWDCPFAYILATLANKTSKVDVEQILGRILRQPYTTQHAVKLLNLSYVFTSSNDFRNTIDGIIRSLQKVGFCRKDFRDVTYGAAEIPNTAPAPVTASRPLFQAETESDNQETESSSDDELEIDIDNVDSLRSEIEAETLSSDIQQLQQQAMQMSDEYTKNIEEHDINGDIDPLSTLNSEEMYYPINEQFGDVAINMNLPIFFIKTSESIFFSDKEWIPLEKAILSEGFDLSTKDANIDFTIVRPDGIMIDVADSGDAVRKSNQSLTDSIRKLYVDKSASTKKEVLCKQIASMIRLDNIPDYQLREYVKRAINRLDAGQIDNLIDNIHLTRDAIRNKIELLLNNHRRKIFSKWLATGRIKLKGHYTFIDKITLRDELVGIDKGLYAAEENVNGFEYDAIAAIAEHPNVLFWHRNRDRNEFCLNGFINHYPDFIVQMKSGVTILIETKGDHLDNTESEEKRWLGNKWADLAGDGFKYFMVFQSKEVDGAITLKTLIQLLDEL